MKKSKLALVLSGGGSRGAYQIGVWQALREMDIHPAVITGTSVGAINGAMILQGNIELAAGLWEELETHMVFDIDIETRKKIGHSLDLEVKGLEVADLLSYASEIIKKGGAGTSSLHSILNNYIDEDVIRKSPIDYGLVAVELPEFIPHYLYKREIPQGKLVDYILASASCFPAVKSYDINGTQFIDGGYADNMPVGMASAMGASPIIAVDLEAIGIVKKRSPREQAKTIKISSEWDLGNFLIFDKANTRRILRLGYLDTLKVFDVFDGYKFTFVKGSFDKKTLPLADAAAEVFELSPLKIYRRDIFDARLSDAITNQLSEAPSEVVPDLFRGKFAEAFSAFSKAVNKKAFAISVAKAIIAEPAYLRLLTPKLRRLMGPELAAVQYLIQSNLVK